MGLYKETNEKANAFALYLASDLYCIHVQVGNRECTHCMSWESQQFVSLYRHLAVNIITITCTHVHTCTCTNILESIIAHLVEGRKAYNYCTLYMYISGFYTLCVNNM